LDAKALDAELTRLHGGPDSAQLCAMHMKAVDLKNDLGWQRFHLTHAWIYALVEGDHKTEADLANTLRALGGL